jgi:hypothetical protein
MFYPDNESERERMKLFIHLKGLKHFRIRNAYQIILKLTFYDDYMLQIIIYISCFACKTVENYLMQFEKMLTNTPFKN